MEEMVYDDLIPKISFFVHRKCEPGWMIIESVMDYWDISYVIKGCGQYWINGQRIIVQAGDLMCVPQGSVRSAEYISENPMEVYSTNFRIAPLSDKKAELPFPLIYNIGYHQDIVSLYQEFNSEWLQCKSGYRLKTRAIFMLILNRFFEIIIYKKSAIITDPRIREIVRYVTEHYSEPLTIGDMANMCGLNHVYFGTLFKQNTGYSFRQYLMKIRLNYAENMLMSGEYNVNEVSLACGFSDVCYFSREYKACKGMTPSKVSKIGQ